MNLCETRKKIFILDDATDELEQMIKKYFSKRTILETDFFGRQVH